MEWEKSKGRVALEIMPGCQTKGDLCNGPVLAGEVVPCLAIRCVDQRDRRAWFRLASHFVNGAGFMPLMEIAVPGYEVPSATHVNELIRLAKSSEIVRRVSAVAHDECGGR